MTTLAGPTQSTSRDRAVAKRPQRTGQRRLPWTAAGLGLILSGLSTAGWLVQADAAVVYPDCSAVWEAIGQPLSADAAGYSSRLDADGDGVACELDPREGSRAGGGAVVDAGLDPIPDTDSVFPATLSSQSAESESAESEAGESATPSAVGTAADESGASQATNGVTSASPTAAVVTPTPGRSAEVTVSRPVSTQSARPVATPEPVATRAESVVPTVVAVTAELVEATPDPAGVATPTASATVTSAPTGLTTSAPPVVITPTATAEPTDPGESASETSASQPTASVDVVADPIYENCAAVWEVLGRPLTENERGYAASRLDRDNDGVACEDDPRPAAIVDAEVAVADPVYYRNCADAAAAGAAPIQAGQPGYRAELDLDGDGVACEDSAALDGLEAYPLTGSTPAVATVAGTQSVLPTAGAGATAGGLAVALAAIGLGFGCLFIAQRQRQLAVVTTARRAFRVSPRRAL